MSERTWPRTMEVQCRHCLRILFRRVCQRPEDFYPSSALVVDHMADHPELTFGVDHPYETLVTEYTRTDLPEEAVV